MPVRPDRPDVGDQPVLFIDCTDVDGNATDPTDGRLLVQKPGAANSIEIEFAQFVVAPNGQTGRVEWTVSPALDVPGVWKFWWEFTAGVILTEPYEFAVADRTVPLPA